MMVLVVLLCLQHDAAWVVIRLEPNDRRASQVEPFVPLGPWRQGCRLVHTAVVSAQAMKSHSL